MSVVILLRVCSTLVFSWLAAAGAWAWAEDLETQLGWESFSQLAAEARQTGDAARGAVVFYQPALACARCHIGREGQPALGPDLTQLGRDVSDAQIVEAILEPSRTIRKGFETVNIITESGRTLVAFVVRKGADEWIVRDVTREGETVRLRRDEIQQVQPNRASVMPKGQVNQLSGRQAFLDLVRFLIEIRDGGAERLAALQPAPNLLAPAPLPEYEDHIDHARLLQSLDSQAYARGEKIYLRLCVNCHGTVDQPGSLPTSLRFASGKFKNGADPYSMYQTLTRGFGLMAPQRWMVPRQKYDVIHYIREAYLRPHNPTQYVAVDAAYLAALPRGDTLGPEPVEILEWERMDYGVNLVGTYELSDDGSNIVYKGNAVGLDCGVGGISRAHYWSVFDFDTLRLAGVWTGDRFIDWNGIAFNGSHGVHPHVSGRVLWTTPPGPGWANPEDGSFRDPRLRGRDGRPYGPLPREWAHLRGMYQHGSAVVVSYTVGDVEVLERTRLAYDANDASGQDVMEGASQVVQRILQIGPRTRDMLLRVAAMPERDATRVILQTRSDHVIFGAGAENDQDGGESNAQPAFRFDGHTYVEIEHSEGIRLDRHDFSIAARLRTRKGGTIFCETGKESKWVPHGKTFFIRNGRLAFDIGWVGVVQSRKRLDDGQWHDVAVTYAGETGDVRLFIDGKQDGQGRLVVPRPLAQRVLRIGYTAADFPKPQTFFQGDLAYVRLHDRTLSTEELARAREADTSPVEAIAHWEFTEHTPEVADRSGRHHTGRWVRGEGMSSPASGWLVAGLVGESGGARFESSGHELRLRIPAGDGTLRMALWMARVDTAKGGADLARRAAIAPADLDLSALTHGGPARWPERLETRAVRNASQRGAFAVDVLTHPVDNPWFCRMRLTAFDFFADGDRAAVSDWEGNVWMVSGLSALDGDGSPPSGGAGPTVPLVWRRIASGLFQPLGLLIHDDVIHVTCRDQICRLHDLNGDGEIDFYENFNNDHQVTEHFHEFAMGLQRDAQGNFYYAKSARHALPAVVPHHGTLLRVSADGLHTDIVATGFRAANGVCLNPDGTFFVTDQEGHWTPKNRINWVREGGFYGNMFGYHDVTDPSDEAMIPPVCWITNAFDRSPAELLWVDSPKWGALRGSLLNLSYGYGKVYIVPHQRVGDLMQGGMCELPIGPFPTGIMRGRFHGTDGQLYVCGMFAWAGNQTQPGGFYRIRYLNKPAYAPIGYAACTDGLHLTFSEPLDPAAATDPTHFTVRAWDLKRTANYGSNHYNEREWKVRDVALSDDHRTVRLDIEGLAPTWCLEVVFRLRGETGEPVDGRLHGTIHRLAPAATSPSSR